MAYPRENTIQTEATSAANAAATIKLPKGTTGALPGDQGGDTLNPIGANQRYRLKSIFASYGGAANPTTPGTLTVTDGVFTWTFDVTGPLTLNPLDVQCAPGAEVDITLGAGGASLIGHVNVSFSVEG